MQEATGLHPVPPVTRLSRGADSEQGKAADDKAGEGGVFTPEIKARLAEVFEKMARPLVLNLALDERPVSEEPRRFMEELAGMTDKLRLSLPACSTITPTESRANVKPGTNCFMPGIWV